MGNAGRGAKGAVSATGNVIGKGAMGAASGIGTVASVTGKGVMGAASAIKNRVTRKKTNGGSNNKTRKKGGSLTTPVVEATDGAGANPTPDVAGTDAGTNATNTGAEGAVVEGPVAVAEQPQQSQETPAVAEPVAAATTNAGTNADAVGAAKEPVTTTQPQQQPVT